MAGIPPQTSNPRRAGRWRCSTSALPTNSLRSESGLASRPPTSQTELRAGGEPVYTSEALLGFYVRRLYRPAWIDEHGPTRLVDDLVNALCLADLEGLRPEDYQLAAIETLVTAVRTDVRSREVIAPDRWAELDLLLTNAFLVYGSHLLAGRVNPESLEQEWVANRRGADFAAVLEAALASGDVAGTLATLEPPHRGFRRLRDALVHQRAVAARGGWPTIPEGPTLRRRRPQPSSGGASRAATSRG